MIHLLAGILLGFLAGLLPGINISFIMILSFPFLIGSDLQSVLIFYIAVMASSQYSGSISALLLGIPGETTSLPATNIRKQINNNQKEESKTYSILKNYNNNLDRLKNIDINNEINNYNTINQTEKYSIAWNYDKHDEKLHLKNPFPAMQILTKTVYSP